MFLFTWQSLFRVSDAGMNVLLLFMTSFFSLLVSSFGIKCLDNFVQLWPRNVSSARRFIGHVTDIFSKFAICPYCDSIYPLESCKIKLPDQSMGSRKCSFVQFPQHPRTCQRSPCNIQLLKQVRTSAGTTMLYPHRLYCYCSLVDSLKEMVKHPRFVEKCEMWRDRVTAENTLSDIYDGKVWKNFMNPDEKPYLSVPFW